MGPPEVGTTVVTIGAAAVSLAPTAKVLIERMLGPTADSIGLNLKQKYDAYLLRNAGKAVAKAAAMVSASGKEANPIPLRTAVPLLEGAAREDDDALSEKWAALIANASIAEKGDAVPPYFATVLSQFSPLEARVLQLLADTEPLTGTAPGTLDGPPKRPRFVAQQFLVADVPEANEARAVAAIDLIVSLGLATRQLEDVVKISETENLYFQGGVRDLEIQITSLGLRFLAACEAPPAR